MGFDDCLKQACGLSVHLLVKNFDFNIEINSFLSCAITDLLLPFKGKLNFHGNVFSSASTDVTCLIAGVIKTALPNMDREAKDQYLLVIQAKDMVGQNGGLSGTTSVTVTLTDVNDNPPRFPRRKLLGKKYNCYDFFKTLLFALQVVLFLNKG